MRKVGELEVWHDPENQVIDVIYNHVTDEADGEWATNYRATYVFSPRLRDLRLIDSNHPKLPAEMLAEVAKHSDKLKTILLLTNK